MVLQATERGIMASRYLSNRPAKMSAAASEEAVQRMRDWGSLINSCMTASTSVIVFPVPGGPNIKYGATPELRRRMSVTACSCFSFSALLARVSSTRAAGSTSCAGRQATVVTDRRVSTVHVVKPPSQSKWNPCAVQSIGRLKTVAKYAA
eukprot:scaffold1021_cov241-Pinguiococcus_pyrenoidosus.AAC.12